MPVTDLAKANFFTRRVVGAIDLKDRFFDSLLTAHKRLLKTIYTGVTSSTDLGRWFQAVTVTNGSGSNDLTFSTALYGTDGNGNEISVALADSRITNVPFQDTAATTYRIGVRVAEVPHGLKRDTATGVSEYDYTQWDIGHSAAPTVVVDNGEGTITLTLGSHALDGSDDFTGREAVVYLVDPVATDEATAIETCTVSGTTITTIGGLGQSAISVVAADYIVVLKGPTITRLTTLSASVGWAYVGTVVGGGGSRVFSFAGQPVSNLIPSTLAAFQVEHNNDLLDADFGKHKKVNWDNPKSKVLNITLASLNEIGGTTFLNSIAGYKNGGGSTTGPTFVINADAVFIKDLTEVLWDASGRGIIINNIGINYKNNNAGNMIYLSLLHKSKSNTSGASPQAIINVDTQQLVSDITNVWGYHIGSSINHTVVADQLYWVEVFVDYTAGNLEMESIRIDYTEAGLSTT